MDVQKQIDEVLTSAISQTPQAWQDRQDRFDALLADACQRLQGEFSSLLGVEVWLGAPENHLTTREEFFHQESGAALLMTDMEIRGDINGATYLFCSLQDAIHLGGTLIMLPPSELEIVVAEEDLTADTEDAYSEIANIAAGTYSSIFGERAGKKFRLVKRGLRKLPPPTSENTGDAPIPDILYYQSAMAMRVNGKELGQLRLLLPADALGLRPPVETDAAPARGDTPAAGETHTEAMASSAADTEAAAGVIEALVIGDDDIQADRVAAILAEAGMTAKKIGFRDNLYSWLPGQVRVIFLVMRQADERAFGIAIKISAVCPLPLVAVAPGWTRSRVIKAARYGISDILTSPASAVLIGESLRHNLAAS